MSIHTDEELETLNLTNQVRKDVVKNMTKGGVPEKVGDLRVLNEYMNSLDDTVQRSTANRLKHSENENQEAVAAIVAAALTKTKINAAIPTTDRVIDVLDEYIPVDIVPGETDINPNKLIPSDFISDLDDAE